MTQEIIDLRKAAAAARVSPCQPRFGQKISCPRYRIRSDPSNESGNEHLPERYKESLERHTMRTYLPACSPFGFPRRMHSAPCRLIGMLSSRVGYAPGERAHRRAIVPASRTDAFAIVVGCPAPRAQCSSKCCEHTGSRDCGTCCVTGLFAIT